ncbi:hypothetical protein ADK38_42745, partial [Streptomyces varsoviensis]
SGPVHRDGDRYFAVGRADVPGGDRVQRLGLSVVTTVPVPSGTAVGSDRLLGPLAAVVLLVIALLVAWWLVRRVQRPLRVLDMEAARLVRGSLDRPVPATGRGETARIGATLETLRRQLLGEGERPV